MYYRLKTFDTRSAHSVAAYFCRRSEFKYSFFIYTFKNGINWIYNYQMQDLSKNSEILYLNLADLLLT